MITQLTVVAQLANRHEGFQNPTKVGDALRIFLDAVGNPRIQSEYVRVDQSLGRVLSDDIVANQFVPQIDRAEVDGFAVRSSDVRDASKTNPVILRIVGESKIGETNRKPVKPGQAVAVATGGGIPSGVDTVVMVERTNILPAHEVAVVSPSVAGEKIFRRGEDAKPGTIVLARSRRIRSQDMGLLKALAIAKVRVVRKPRVAIISTGNELVDSPRGNRPSKIVDINRPILSEMVRELGCLPMDLGVVRDDEAAIMTVLRKGVKSCDAVIVTAGSSVGERDLVPRCVNRLGRPGLLVHGVAMRPAMPTGLAVVNGKPILSLPGFPVSAIFGFRVFGRPLVARLLGSEKAVDPVVKAVLKENISKPLGFLAFIRVTIRRTRDGLVAEPLKVQRSSVLMSMIAANGIVTVPEDVAIIESGQEVEVEVIGEITL